MSAKISQYDAVYLLPLPETFNGKGWHGKGIPLEEFTPKTVAKALFTHEMVDAGFMGKRGAVKQFFATGQRYAIATDNNRNVGPAVGPVYWTPQNAELFELVCNALAGSEYRICSVLTLDERREFAVDAVGTHMKAGSKRDVAPFVGLHRAFGGTSSLTFSGHAKVMQCANTTSLFLREASKRDDAQSFRNTGGLSDRMDEVKKAFEKAHGVNAEFARALADADSVPMTVDDARAAYASILCDKKPLLGESGNRKTVNRVKALVGLFRTGKGNSGETVGDWFNGATEFYTFQSSGGDRDPSEIKVLPGEAPVDPKDKQFYTSEYGTGRTFKTRLANCVFDAGRVNVKALEAMVDNGRKLIDRADAKILKEAEFFA